MADRRIELIIAYRAAGLHEKADALAKEMVAEHISVVPDPNGFKKIGDELDKTMDEIADRLGLPRKRRK